MYEFHYLRALGITILTETLLLFLIIRYWYKMPEARIARDVILLGGILSSGVTLPHIWFILPVFLKNFYLYSIVAECFAVIAEAAIFVVLFRVSWPKACGLALLCNLGSFGTGKFISWLMQYLFS